MRAIQHNKALDRGIHLASVGFCRSSRPGRVHIEYSVSLRYPPSATLMTVGRFNRSSSPRASKQLSTSLVDLSNKKADFEYLTFYFWEDGDYADVAWTIKYSTTLGARVSAILQDYATRECRSEGAGDVLRATKALNGFCMILELEDLAREANVRKMRSPKMPAPQDDSRQTDQHRFGGALGEHIERRLKGKTSIWSYEEVRRLMRVRLAGRPLKVIASELGKTKKCVVQMLEALGGAPFEQVLADGPQAMPDALRLSLFHARLRDIWHVLSREAMTEEWEKAIAQISDDELLSTISQCILPEVKYLLEGFQPPTFEQIRALPTRVTRQAGVYARLLESHFEHQGACDRLLYIGSATRQSGGLNSRIFDHHTGFGRQRFESRLQRDIKKRDLKVPGDFATLMIMGMTSADPKHVETVRRTVVIAEAILTVWLGALQEPRRSMEACTKNLRRALPWLRETLDYFPGSSHNPLLVDVFLQLDAREDKPMLTMVVYYTPCMAMETYRSERVG